MNGACKDEGWLKIPSTQLHRCRGYFKSAICTHFFTKMTHFSMQRKSCLIARG